MDKNKSRGVAFGWMTLKIYLIVSAAMFIGGVVGGAALALAGYDLPGIG
jgi:hypothetical protein